MRPDFNKLLCERERPRSKDKYCNYRKLRSFDVASNDEEYETLLQREGMKKRYGYDTKNFNENLNPLEGFLRARLGRNWDDVYSEICSTFDKRSVINQHILIHLFQYVEIQIAEIDGELKYFSPYEYYESNGWKPIARGYFDYYVDPRDGCLMPNVGKKTHNQINRELAAKRKAEEAKVYRKLNETDCLRKEDGIWYSFTNEPYVATVSYLDPETKLTKYRSETRFYSKKKQLNKKELKFYGLNK